MYTFITKSKLSSLKYEWFYAKDFILGINDNGVRDLAHSMHHGGLVGITCHLRDKLIKKLKKTK